MKRIVLLVIMALLAFPSLADAKNKKKNKKRYRPNMPAGWAWPPNQEMKNDGALCLQQLDAIGLVWKPGKATKKIATPVVVDSMEFGGVKFVPVWRKGTFVMDCHLALALATSAGPALRTAGVKQVEFFGIYTYRNVKGTKILSRHSLGLAMDIGVLVTDDGSRHEVKKDYKKEDSVLLESEKLLNMTGAFRMLLTPGNDPKKHWDHFHLEARTPRDKVVTPKSIKPKEKKKVS